jgi:uncharacterized protein YbjT (DUF2867 family)
VHKQFSQKIMTNNSNPSTKAMPPNVVFIAGNGVVGHRVAERLLKAGYGPIRVGVEDSAKATDLKKHGAQVAMFSFEDESTYPAAIAGAKYVLFNVDPLLHTGLSEHFKAFYNACRAGHVEHIVKISFFQALTATRARLVKGFGVSLPKENPFQHVPLMMEHGNCDEIVMKGSIPYTILSTTHKMSDPLTFQAENLKNHGKLCGASDGKVVNYVSPNDIAACAVRVLTDPKHHHRVAYSLTGPSTMKDRDMATILSKHLDKKVNFVEMSPSDFIDEEKKVEHDPDWLLRELVKLEQLKASGIEQTFASKDFEKICGRAPESFEDYLSCKTEMTSYELAAF